MKAQNGSEGVSMNGPQTPRSPWVSPMKRASRATARARRRSSEDSIRPPSGFRRIISQPVRRIGNPQRVDHLFGLEVAEEEGFEPPVPLGTAVFKTAALNHSATPPGIAV